MPSNCLTALAVADDVKYCMPHDCLFDVLRLHSAVKGFHLGDLERSICVVSDASSSQELTVSTGLFTS